VRCAGHDPRRVPGLHPKDAAVAGRGEHGCTGGTLLPLFLCYAGLAVAFFVRFTAAFFAGFADERAAALKALLGIASCSSEVVRCPAPSRRARAMM
jgi:hypothetical protein